MVLVGLYFGWQQIERASLNRETQVLNEKIQTLDKELTEAKKIQTIMVDIDKWSATDICWLDEIDALCAKFPQSNEAMLVKLILGQGPLSKGGRITLEGLAKSSDNIITMEQRLSDPTHQVTNEGNSDDGSISPYKLRFNDRLTISIAPPAKPLPAQPKRGK